MSRIACSLALVVALVSPAALAETFIPDFSVKKDGAADFAAGCGNVGYVGCCVDDTHSKYCSNGKLIQKTCSGATPSCGWNKLGANFVYTCGTTTDTDPSGTYKRLCTAIPDGGPAPDPDWSVKTDKGTPKTEAGTKVDSGTVIPCGAITSAGCCVDDTTTKYCASGSLKTKACTGTDKCGWSKTGYFCGATTDSDPTGANPRLCSAVVAKDGGPTKKDTGGTSPDTGSTGGDTGTTPKKDTGTTTKPSGGDDGCSCSVKNPASAGSLLLVVGLFFVLSLARRRRR